MKTCGKLALAAAVMTLCAMQAQGESIQVKATYNGTVDARRVDITGVPVKGTVQTYAAMFDFDLVEVTGDGEGDGLDLSPTAVTEQLQAGFQGFCIDLTHTISTGSPGPTYIWDLVPLTQVNNNGAPINSATATAITYLWGSHFEEVLTDSGDTKAATFQVALWKLIYGNVLGFSLLSGDIVTAAAGWAEDATDSQGYAAPVYALVDRSNDPTQGVAITIVGGGTPPPVVPLPAAVWSGMSMLGALGVGAAIRKRFRRS